MREVKKKKKGHTHGVTASLTGIVLHRGVSDSKAGDVVEIGGHHGCIITLHVPHHQGVHAVYPEQFVGVVLKA